MKKKTMKKVAHAHLKGRWWSGTKEPYFRATDTDGGGVWITEARMPAPVREFLRRETIRRGACWLDAPYIVEAHGAAE